MANHKKQIIEILNQFQQTDYKRGGFSIAPEMYEAIANKICTDVIQGEIKAKEHFRKQRDNNLIFSNQKK